MGAGVNSREKMDTYSSLLRVQGVNASPQRRSEINETYVGLIHHRIQSLCSGQSSSHT
jgi:hypothetical protein